MTAEKNQRILKNTLLLYSRTFVAMFVSLYTSRVVLDVLGVDDYGLYNLIGGMVVLFSSLSTSMSVTVQRFLSLEIGLGNGGRINQVFCMSVSIYFLFSVVFLVLVEVIGVWLIYNYLNIDKSRLDASFWVLQSSVASLLILINGIPFHAVVMAHEKMGVFTFAETFHVVLRLVIAFAINTFQYDKLILYSILLAVLTFLSRSLYVLYVKRHFKELHFRLFWDRGLFKEISGFAIWTTLGDVITLVRNQGINVLLNIFIGIAVNAAVGIANQVNAGISGIARNIQTAVFPQITKSYAEKDTRYMNSLILSGAKLSCAFLMVLSLPILIEIDFILNVWLKQVPEYTSLLVRLVLIETIINNLSYIITAAIRATGKIQRYSIVMNTIQIISFAVCYLLLRYTASVFYAYLNIIIAAVVSGIISLFICVNHVKISPVKYFFSIYIKMSLVFALSFFPPWLLSHYMAYGIVRFLAICVAGGLGVVFFTCFIGLNKKEKAYVRDAILRKFITKEIR
jgi:O-antigen/teichoic acid export membrane protein